MGLKRAYHHLSEEKRVVIMTLAREGFSDAHIARHCGVSEAAISREFSRQSQKISPWKNAADVMNLLRPRPGTE